MDFPLVKTLITRVKWMLINLGDFLLVIASHNIAHIIWVLLMLTVVFSILKLALSNF